MKRAVVITGLCRAGGAAVAEVCHVLGFPMGRTFAAPIAPDYRSDWEDAELTWKMAGNVEAGLQPLDRMYVPADIRSRLGHARLNGFGSSIGFKSPLFSIGNARDLLDYALDYENVEAIWISVVRDPLAIRASIARQQGAHVMARWNELSTASGPVPFDYQLLYEELVADPALQVEQLARRLGVDDPVRIRQATARVAKPCS